MSEKQTTPPGASRHTEHHEELRRIGIQYLNRTGSRIDWARFIAAEPEVAEVVGVTDNGVVRPEIQSTASQYVWRHFRHDLALALKAKGGPERPGYTMGVRAKELVNPVPVAPAVVRVAPVAVKAEPCFCPRCGADLAGVAVTVRR